MTTHDRALPEDAFSDAASQDAASQDVDLRNVETRREVLNAYIDGELSAEQGLLVSRWLDSNPGALREVEHLRHLWDLLENYEDEPVPEEFAAGVLQALGHEVGHEVGQGGHPETSSERVIQMAWYRRPLATAAAVLIAIGATALLMSSRSSESLFTPGNSSTEETLASETLASASGLEALGVEDLESLEFLDVIADADDDTFDALVADGGVSNGGVSNGGVSNGGVSNGGVSNGGVSEGRGG